MYLEMLQQRYANALAKQAATPAEEAAKALGAALTDEHLDELNKIKLKNPHALPVALQELTATGGNLQGNEEGFGGGYNRGHGATLLGGGLGGALGAGTGALLSEEDKLKGALMGGAIGSSVGALAAPPLMREALKSQFMNKVVAKKFPKLMRALKNLQNW